MTTGIIDRFRTMPLRSGAVLTGHVVASLARNLVATAVVIARGARSSASARPRRRSSGSRVFGLVALWILAITYLFAAIGLAASTPEAASGYGFILLFLPYLSSAFVPVETMPDWLQWIAENQPITPIIETLRSLLMGTPMGDSAWWAVGWCVGHHRRLRGVGRRGSSAARRAAADASGTDAAAHGCAAASRRRALRRCTCSGAVRQARGSRIERS